MEEVIANYSRGGLQLSCEDCMALMARYPDRHFDLAIVDPPYGRGEDGGKDRSHICAGSAHVKKDWDQAPPPPEYFRELRRVSRSQIIWGINYMPVHLPGGRIIWDKCNDGSDQSGAEVAFCSMNQRVDVVRYLWRGMMQGESIARGTVQQGDKSKNEKRIHPTQKPVKLYEWLLSRYVGEGSRILDTHLGSGSLAVACHLARCELVACELDPDYFAAACARLDVVLAQQTLI